MIYFSQFISLIMISFHISHFTFHMLILYTVTCSSHAVTVAHLI